MGAAGRKEEETACRFGVRLWRFGAHAERPADFSFKYLYESLSTTAERPSLRMGLAMQTARQDKPTAPVHSTVQHAHELRKTYHEENHLRSDRWPVRRWCIRPGDPCHASKACSSSGHGRTCSPCRHGHACARTSHEGRSQTRSQGRSQDHGQEEHHQEDARCQEDQDEEGRCLSREPRFASKCPLRRAFFMACPAPAACPYSCQFMPNSRVRTR